MMFDYSEPRTYSVLCLTGPTGLKYYGKTGIRPKDAWESGYLFRNNKRLKNDIKQYSFAAFSKEIIAENISLEEAEEVLRQSIRKDKTDNPAFGYNQNSGPKKKKDYDVYVLIFSNGKKYVGMTSNTVNTRWRKGYRANEPLLAAIAREGGLKNVKKEHFDYPLSRESAERIETTLINYLGTMNPQRGYNRRNGKGLNDSDLYVSQETLKKMKYAQADYAKPVRCIETGEEFFSMSEAARKINQHDARNLHNVCKGRGKTCGGYHWEFVNKDDKKEN